MIPWEIALVAACVAFYVGLLASALLAAAKSDPPPSRRYPW